MALTFTEFNSKYGTKTTAQIYADWLPVAIARASIFPLAFRDLAVEYYHGYLLCTTSAERQPSELKSFEIKPEGYNVSYADNAPKCDQWLNRLRELAIGAGVEIPEFQKVTALGADRVEKFQHPF